MRRWRRRNQWTERPDVRGRSSRPQPPVSAGSSRGPDLATGWTVRPAPRGHVCRQREDQASGGQKDQFSAGSAIAAAGWPGRAVPTANLWPVRAIASPPAPNRQWTNPDVWRGEPAVRWGAAQDRPRSEDPNADDWPGPLFAFRHGASPCAGRQAMGRGLATLGRSWVEPHVETHAQHRCRGPPRRRALVRRPAARPAPRPGSRQGRYWGRRSS